MCVPYAPLPPLDILIDASFSLPPPPPQESHCNDGQARGALTQTPTCATLHCFVVKSKTAAKRAWVKVHNCVVWRRRFGHELHKILTRALIHLRCNTMCRRRLPLRA